MSSQNRAANGNPKQLTLALDITSPGTTETRHQLPLTRREATPSTRHHRGAVARINLAIYTESPDEAGEVHIHWRLADEGTASPVQRPRVVPMQMCPKCDRGFRAAEPGLCRDCRGGTNAVES